MSTVCRSCSNRVQRLQDGWNNTPPSSGSRRRAPRALRPERGVTQSIPIDGLVATPWSAVDRGTARVTPRPKSLRLVLQSGHFPLIRRKAAGESGIVASATFLSTENSRGLKP